MIAFASQLSYQEFLNQSHQLSKLESYPQLTSRAERIGFKISKVVYRGYQASRTLQVNVIPHVQFFGTSGSELLFAIYMDMPTIPVVEYKFLKHKPFYKFSIQVL